MVAIRIIEGGQALCVPRCLGPPAAVVRFVIAGSLHGVSGRSRTPLASRTCFFARRRTRARDGNPRIRGCRWQCLCSRETSTYWGYAPLHPSNRVAWVADARKSSMRLAATGSRFTSTHSPLARGEYHYRASPNHYGGRYPAICSDGKLGVLHQRQAPRAFEIERLPTPLVVCALRAHAADCASVSAGFFRVKLGF